MLILYKISMGQPAGSKKLSNTKVRHDILCHERTSSLELYTSIVVNWLFFMNTPSCNSDIFIISLEQEQSFRGKTTNNSLLEGCQAN